jgi:uncharacterized protein YdhG (YjbR/CyaY superfamily)
VTLHGPAPADIDAYIAGFPPEVRAILERIRSTVRAAAPQAREAIRYGMPAFVSQGALIYFAAFKKHIGIFPPVVGDARLIQAAAKYAGPKGNLRLPLDQPIPYPLIARIVKQRLKAVAARRR